MKTMILVERKQEEKKEMVYSMATLEQLAMVVHRTMDIRLEAWRGTIIGLGIEEDYEAEKHIALAEILQGLRSVNMPEKSIFTATASYIRNASNKAAERFYNDFIKHHVEFECQTIPLQVFGPFPY